MVKVMSQRWVIGIDEVGRGALAGPLVVAAVVMRTKRELKDSKQLSAKQRDKVLQEMQSIESFFSATALVSSALLDRYGMTASGVLAVDAVLRSIRRLLPDNSRPFVLLDGGLRASGEYPQVTVIRGDAQLTVIAAASIVAKEYRDRLMRQEHQRFPQYGFDAHVGYGTKRHYKALSRHGPSVIHRKSFRLT